MPFCTSTTIHSSTFLWYYSARVVFVDRHTPCTRCKTVAFCARGNHSCVRVCPCISCGEYPAWPLTCPGRIHTNSRPFLVWISTVRNPCRLCCIRHRASVSPTVRAVRGVFLSPHSVPHPMWICNSVTETKDYLCNVHMCGTHHFRQIIHLIH